MGYDHLDAPEFEIEKSSQTISLQDTPFFYNDNGTPVYLAELPSGIEPLTPTPTDPQIAIGREYVVPEILGIKATPPFGVETQIGLLGERIEFEPLWATRATAAAFGMTFVKRGEAVRVSSPVTQLAQIKYEYGVFAGHWSPYQNTGKRLLTVVCTDLEHHNFPHVFCSTDSQMPLVISVGRYWPKLSRIRLADLWVPRGAALYIPPKPALHDAQCIDLHNNRNSARACWGDIERSTITTHTLLQAHGGFFYWYWNAKDTTHFPPLDE
ncbi:MAG: hypothetical protein ACP5P4_04895 [Steroidobacteraceae bacterium]